MENSRGLPIAAIVIAVLLALLTYLSYQAGEAAEIFHLSELEIAYVAAAVGLVTFGIQGLISVLLEGRRLRPGRVRPRLTDPLTVAIVIFSIALFADAVVLGYAIYEDWSPIRLGLLAGAGCIIIALLLIFYKEAFVGNEATFDDREDGVPW
jgi:hypothetical protein